MPSPFLTRHNPIVSPGNSPLPLNEVNPASLVTSVQPERRKLEEALEKQYKYLTEYDRLIGLEGDPRQRDQYLLRQEQTKAEITRLEKELEISLPSENLPPTPQEPEPPRPKPVSIPQKPDTGETVGRGNPAPTATFGPMPQLNQAEADEDWDTVIELGEQILARDERHRNARIKTTNAYIQRGIIYFQEDDYEIAIEDFNSAIRLNSRSAEAYYRRGLIYLRQENKLAARQDFSQAAPNHPQAKEELAKIEAEEAAVRAEQERLVREEAERKEAERKAREEAERKARQEAEYARQKQLADLTAQLNQATDRRAQIAFGSKIIALHPPTLDHWLSQDESIWQRTAAEVLLARRLENLHPLDQKRQIDLSYLTCVEYQLFLDEKRTQGQYYQPDHWLSFRFPQGQAREFVFGVRAWDARAFCEWLTKRQNDGTLYRLPLSNEANQFSVLPADKATWCKDSEQFKLGTLPAGFEELIQKRLAEFTKTDLPLSISVNLDLARARARARARALDQRKIADAINRNDLAEAKRLSQQLQKSRNIYDVRLGNLLVDLLDCAMAQTEQEAVKAQWRYIARIAEYCYIGFGEMQGYKKQQQTMLELYWWLQIVIARAEGKLPAWEGIRIVRERKD